MYYINMQLNAINFRKMCDFFIRLTGVYYDNVYKTGTNVSKLRKYLFVFFTYIYQSDDVEPMFN